MGCGPSKHEDTATDLLQDESVTFDENQRTLVVKKNAKFADQKKRMPSMRMKRDHAKHRSSRTVDFTKLKSQIPISEDAEGKRARAILFQKCGQGAQTISREQCQKASASILKLGDIGGNALSVIELAFTAVVIPKVEGSPQVLRPCDFLPFLRYIVEYFELWFIFDSIDQSDDHFLSLEEWRKALPKLQTWKLEMTEDDLNESYTVMDKDHDQTVDFQEFADWAIKYKGDYVKYELEHAQSYDFSESMRTDARFLESVRGANPLGETSNQDTSSPNNVQAPPNVRFDQ